ncbi:hypothetical protein M9H77_29712 [Catharanthus roseus]|uniref:Uncharacterized protein n=1 Tax=Catharanthus roseus TaxID=4058 RepID=A0ACB9ZV84_CATRO|nr:hypothetical protein M9H77_29712 [Catharanthus roseus]
MGNALKINKPFLSKLVEETLVDTQCMIINRDLTWGLMKQALKTKFGVGNHEGQRQGQLKVKFIESSMVKESPKVIELSQATIEESFKIHVLEEISKEEPSCIMSEKSIEIKEKKEWKKKRD